MTEFTKEQVDKMIADATKGLFTEDELNRRVTAEVDRRVDTGIKKGIETERSKWEREFQERAKLTAEEIAQKEIEIKMKEISAKEKNVLKKENLLEAKDMLANASIPKNHYEKLIDDFVSDDPEVTKRRVENFINVFTEVKTEIETKIKSEFVNVSQPKTGSGDKPITKEDFINMGYAKKLELKQNNPELYKKFIE